jgi:hypothetical protein
MVEGHPHALRGNGTAMVVGRTRAATIRRVGITTGLPGMRGYMGRAFFLRGRRRKNQAPVAKTGSSAR